MKAIYRTRLKELSGEFIHDLEEQFGNAPVELVVNTQASSHALEEFQFWSLIDLLDWSQLPDEEKVAAPLIKALAESPVRHIYDFYDFLAEKLFALDTLVHASHIGTESWQEGKPFSADHFLDVRSCAIANGKEFYEKVLHHPQAMPKDMFFEVLPYVPSIAYEHKTGKTFNYLPDFNYHTFSNKAGWAEKAS